MSAFFSDPRETVRPRCRSLSPTVDGLDPRCLLTAGVAPHTALVASQGIIEGNGIVIEKPVFYEDYVGPKLAQLEARAALGRLNPNGSFTFIGVNVGAINPKVQATYVFGVDRIGNLPPGPFPGRPGIQFDATVVVKLVPGHAPTVTVNDLTTKTSTTLPRASLTIERNLVAVNVPGNLLPSKGLAPSQYRYAYWPEDGLAGSTNISSFAPDFQDIPIGVAHRNG